MPFDFKLSLSVSSTRNSRKGDQAMGEWASKAEARFKQSASKDRQDEELELLRHHKTVAGAEGIWDNLVDFIANEVKDFNRRMGREFFTLYKSQTEIGVEAPKLRLARDTEVKKKTLANTIFG